MWCVARVTCLVVIKCKCMVLYSSVSCPSDRSKRFILHRLAGMLIPTLTRLLWEEVSHAAITARRQFTHIFTDVYSQVSV